jgi:polyisoprenoid-binding protein YceI
MAAWRTVIRGYSIATMAMTLTSGAGEPEADLNRDTGLRYSIDSARTVVSFEVRSFGIFKQRGWFGFASGSVTLDPQADEGSFDVVIDARTIRASSNARLQIIRGPGFLNVEKFPEISYKAQHVAFTDGKPIRVDGELTLLGVTHPVPLGVNDYLCTSPSGENGRRCMIDASAMFRRSEFGMTGSMSLAGDKVRLAIHAEAVADPDTVRAELSVCKSQKYIIAMTWACPHDDYYLDCGNGQ